MLSEPIEGSHGAWCVDFRMRAAFHVLIRLRGGPRTRRELARMCGCSPVTVYRVINALRIIGAPLVTDGGSRAEWRLATPLTRAHCAAFAAGLGLPPEALALLLAERAVA